MQQSKETPALQEAIAWQQNAGAWAEGLLQRFPLYTDLLQPVALAVYEIRAGLAMIVTAIQQHMHSHATAVHCSIAVSLIGLPVSPSGSRPTTPLQTLIGLPLQHWVYAALKIQPCMILLHSCCQSPAKVSKVFMAALCLLYAGPWGKCAHQSWEYGNAS